MHVVAIVVALALTAPPEHAPVAEGAPEPEPTTEPKSATEPEPPPDEQNLDCMLDGCEAGAAESTPSAEPEDPGPMAEALKLEGRGLVADGEYAAGIAKLEQAYQLVPGEHLIAYEIAQAAEKARDCDKMRLYLEHFATYADPNTFSNKIEKARRSLRSDACLSSAGVEIREVRATRPSSAAGGSSGDGLVVGGAVMLGLGLLAFAGGIGLAVVGVGQQKAAVRDLEVPDAKYQGYVIGGAILGPCGVAIAVGGIVMMARGNQQYRITLTPTGVQARF